jgi:hypothetical protein
MAQKAETTPQDQKPNAPEFLAWHVSERAGKSWWSKVGAAWRHKDGAGFTLQLEMLPIGGRIVLRQPPDTAEPSAQ